MEPFEYLSVLVSIIVGLALSHLLTSTARLIQLRRSEGSAPTSSSSSSACRSGPR